MANVNAPNGFQQYGGFGYSPTYEQFQMALASTNTTPIYFGDPVTMATSATTGQGTGYISQALAPAIYSITAGTLTNGIMALSGTFPIAIPVGATVVAYGFTSTAATVNGAWQVTASSTTTVSFPFPGAFTTGTGSIAVFTPIAGVFCGCRYLSIAQRKPVFSPYWPGSDANGDVTAYITNDPNAQFNVQTANSNTTATAVGLSAIGQNIGFSLGTGNAASGLSGAYADQYTLASSYPSGFYGQSFLPFKIVNLLNYVPGSLTSLAAQPLGSVPGNDFTSPYNRLIVGFNQSMLKQFAGV